MDEKPNGFHNANKPRFYCASVGRSAAALKDSAEHNRRPSILWVDDDVIGSQMRADAIAQHGYLTALYDSPMEALNCDFSKFDLAIVDFDMPGMNGRDLLLRMRSLGAKFPIILLSGYADALANRDRVLFTRCIDKSRPIQQLLDSIAELLDPDQIPDFGT